MRKRLFVLGAFFVVATIGLSSCGKAGNRYAAIRVDSSPPGASVEYLVTLPAVEYIDAHLGITPTKLIILQYNGMVQGGGKHGVRLHKSGYRGVDVYVDHDKWFGSPNTARENVQCIEVELVPVEELGDK